MSDTTDKRNRVLAALEQHDGQQASERLVVADLMTKSPKCISESTTLQEMVALFHDHGFRHFVVTDSVGRMVGVISDRDVIGCLGPAGSANCDAFADVPAARLMSTDLITIGPNSPISEATDLIVQHGISCLPVLNQGALVGIITNTDLHLLLQLVLQATKRSSLEESVTTSP
jgi:CBS domain-containing protein